MGPGAQTRSSDKVLLTLFSTLDGLPGVWNFSWKLGPGDELVNRIQDAAVRDHDDLLSPVIALDLVQTFCDAIPDCGGVLCARTALALAPPVGAGRGGEGRGWDPTDRAGGERMERDRDRLCGWVSGCRPVALCGIGEGGWGLDGLPVEGFGHLDSRLCEGEPLDDAQP